MAERNGSSPAPVGLASLERRPWVLWLALASAHLALSFSSLTQKSPTYDEAAHLAAGYAALRWADDRLDPAHPPLSRMWATLPWLAESVEWTPAGRQYWEQAAKGTETGRAMAYAVGLELLYGSGADADALLRAARRMMVALTLAGSTVLFLWGRALGGLATGGIAAGLFLLDPNVIAHGQLVGNDVAVAVAMVGAGYCLWRLSREWSWAWTAAAGLAFGASFLTKFSALALAPAMILLLLARALQDRPWPTRWRGLQELQTRKQRLAMAAAGAAVVGLISYLCIWAGYGFRGSPRATDAREVAQETREAPRGWGTRLVAAAQDRRLLPEAYSRGLLAAARLTERKEKAGPASSFFVAALCKTPLSTLMVAAAVGLALVRRRIRLRFDDAFLLVVPLVYFLMLGCAQVYASWRYLLPAKPFLLLFLARCLSQMQWRRWMIAAAVWLIWNAVWTWPHYLAFFNEPARAAAAVADRASATRLAAETFGRTHSGWRLLVDSNVDWGQDLPALTRWMQQRGIQQIYLCYFGQAAPAHYGTGFVNLLYFPEANAQSPWPEIRAPAAPGDLAISATHLQGRMIGPASQQFLARLRARRPVANIGNSILVYTIAPQNVVDPAAP